MRHILVVAALVAAGCGDGDGREDSESMGISASGISGIVTSGSSDGAGSGSETAGASDGETGVQTGTDGGSSTTGTSGGFKFDIGSVPDAPEDCIGNDGMEEDLSYIWIANTEVGTVSKINTRTGVIEGRYNTDNSAQSPSRTTVNQFGDMLVANRGESAGVTAVASFQDRCIDKNNDGVITTSTGYGDVLPWGSDECVLWYSSVPVTYEYGPRAVAWEGGELDPVTCENTVPNPRVWVAFRAQAGNSYEVRRYNGQTGQILNEVSIPGTDSRPYGGAVNREGDFWFVSRGGGRRLVRVYNDGATWAEYTPPGNPYGMSIDQNGDPWLAVYNAGAGDKVYRFDTQSNQFVDSGGGGGYHRGMMIDHQGNAWVVGNNSCRLALFDAANGTLINDSITLPGCSNPVGVSIDIDDYVWIVDQGASIAYKIDPNTFQIMFTVEGLNKPYTYSDMTGSLLRLVSGPLG